MVSDFNAPDPPLLCHPSVEAYPGDSIRFSFFSSLSFSRSITICIRYPCLSICGVLFEFADGVGCYAGCPYWFSGRSEFTKESVIHSFYLLTCAAPDCRAVWSIWAAVISYALQTDITRSNSNILGGVPSLTDTVVSLVECLNLTQLSATASHLARLLGPSCHRFKSRERAKLIDPL